MSVAPRPEACWRSCSPIWWRYSWCGPSPRAWIERLSMQPSLAFRIWIACLGWGTALLMFFPVLWMVVTAFKHEIDAVATPPLLVFAPTLDNFQAVNARANYFGAAFNSVVIALGSTLLGLLVALPASYAMAFFPGKRTKDILLWMMSTKMMPAVGVLVPMYLLFKDLELLDSRTGLVGI